MIHVRNCSDVLKKVFIDLMKHTLTWGDVEYKMDKIPPPKRMMLDYDKSYTLLEIDNVRILFKCYLLMIGAECWKDCIAVCKEESNC